MIKSIITAIFGLLAMIGAVVFALELKWGRVRQVGSSLFTGSSEGDEVEPNPLHYLGCAAFFIFGSLLALAQVPSFERVGGHLFLVYMVGLVGVVATGTGIYLIVRGITTAWRDRHAKKAAEDFDRSQNGLQSERNTGSEIEIDLDVQEKAQEHLTGLVFSFLSPAMRGPAIGLRRAFRR